MTNINVELYLNKNINYKNMTVLHLWATDTLEINDILKSRFFLRFLRKYQQRYNQWINKKYKQYPKRWRSSFSDEFYSDLEDIFWDARELKVFLSGFREEMIMRPHVWIKINEECDDDEYQAMVLSMLQIHFSLCDWDKSIKDICKLKVRNILEDSDQAVNEVNGSTMRESIQIWRDNQLFPIDSQGDIISFISGRHNQFQVFRQISEWVWVVDATWKILQLDKQWIEIIQEWDSQEDLLMKLEDLRLFENIYKAFNGHITQEVTILAEEMDKYGDFIDIWLQGHQGFYPTEWQDIFKQEDGKWWKLFAIFLRESIEKLERKTSRAELQIVK